MEGLNLTLEFTEREKEAIKEVSAGIDLTNRQRVLQYGDAAQREVAEFSQAALAAAKPRELGEIGTMIGQAMAELNAFGWEDTPIGGILGLFRKSEKKAELRRAKLTETTLVVEDISRQLESHQLMLMKDVEILSQMYDKSLEYYKMLSMYILAGKMKLARERETTLSSMQEIARRTGLPNDAQTVKNFEDMCQRFERKLRDLDSTRNIGLRLVSPIRQLQSSHTTLSEQIRSVLLDTIPQWKRAAAEAEQNKDILQATNSNLANALDEVLQIHAESMQKRQTAREQLQKIESDLKLKLLEVRDLA